MFSKFFKNGTTFSAYCRFRYGQSRMIWDNTSLWEKRGRFAIAFDQDAADRLFTVRPEKTSAQEDYDEYESERYLRQQENMAAYIHSGAGLDNYYADQAAGYVE